jgi:hypothetical protein
VSDLLHPQRGGTAGVVPKSGVVVHTSEGSEGGRSSANLVSYLSSPGDRPNGNGGFYGSGYHAVATEDGAYLQVASGQRNPYHAPPLNPTWWSICIPGRAAQTRELWLDLASRAYLKGVAHFIVDVWHLDGERWPLTFRTAAELVAGAQGITSHNEVSTAWRKTDHWDPGPSFPWDVLASDIAIILNPPPTTPPGGDDGMAIKVFQPVDCDAEFIGYCDILGNALQIEWIATAKDQARRDAYLATGVVVVDRGERCPGGFVNCGLIGPIPTGDTKYTWSEGDFAYRIPKTTG